ncbi:MAG: hypothetical protein Q9M91_07440 [Candidatus Dojkabacteria bacterium]|nr:hypothetical protein [Candidatus Dojkabacteria bacterium]
MGSFNSSKSNKSLVRSVREYGVVVIPMNFLLPDVPKNDLKCFVFPFRELSINSV